MSNHSRALAAATSALFWWSANSTSIFLPLIAPPKSAIAILIASTPAGPSMSAYRLDMSVMKPMRITSPEICACAGAAPSSAARRARRRRRLSSVSSRSPWSRGEWKVRAGRSDAEVFVQPLDALRQLGLGELLDHAAVLHHVEAVGQRRGEAEVLLDHHDRVALLAQRDDHLGELLHDHRRQALGDLVEQQQLGAGAQDARHRQHLLLAARQARALAGRALLQVREHRVDLLDAHAARGRARGGSIRFSSADRLEKMPRSSGQ